MRLIDLACGEARGILPFRVFTMSRFPSLTAGNCPRSSVPRLRIAGSKAALIRTHTSCATTIGSIACAVAVSCGAPHAALAQAAGRADASLAPIVVTAARLPQSQADALPFTTVISADQIRASQAVDLPALLRREAGIQFTQTGGIGQASGLFLRGADTRQTLVLLDGVPLTKQDATGTVSIEHLMLDQIDHIEIVRGNISSIYGSSAIGGVVQIFTRRGQGPARVTAEAEAGSRGTTRIAAGVSGSTAANAAGDFHYALNASRFGTNGFSALNTAQVPTANPDRDGYRNSSVSGAVSQDLGRDHRVGANFSATRGKFDFDSNFGEPTDRHAGKTTVSTASIYSQDRFSERWTSRLSYADSRDRNTNRYDTSFSNYDDRYQSHTRMLQWTNEILLTSVWHATAGVERQWQSLSVDDGFTPAFDVNRNASSVFAGLQGQFGAHQLQGNLRHDRTDRIDSATTGYLGYGYLFNPRWKALASIATGFAAPPLGYLYYPGFGNPDLKAEHSRSAELGLQYAHEATLIRAAFFDTRTREQLQFDPTVGDFGAFANIARARNRGLEISASGTLAEMVLRASLTLQDPRDATTGERSRRRARTLASLSAHRSIGAWNVGGDVGFTGSRSDGAQELGAYGLINLNARYRISKAVELFGHVDNLFDRQYQTAHGFNQAPRGVFAGVRFEP